MKLFQEWKHLKDTLSRPVSWLFCVRASKALTFQLSPTVSPGELHCEAEISKENCWKYRFSCAEMMAQATNPHTRETRQSKSEFKDSLVYTEGKTGKMEVAAGAQINL